MMGGIVCALSPRHLYHIDTWAVARRYLLDLETEY